MWYLKIKLTGPSQDSWGDLFQMNHGLEPARSNETSTHVTSTHGPAAETKGPNKGPEMGWMKVIDQPLKVSCPLSGGGGREG